MSPRPGGVAQRGATLGNMPSVVPTGFGAHVSASTMWGWGQILGPTLQARASIKAEASIKGSPAAEPDTGVPRS